MSKSKCCICGLLASQLINGKLYCSSCKPSWRTVVDKVEELGKEQIKEEPKKKSLWNKITGWFSYGPSRNWR